jgi:outer membrane protein OmpA-like peptidoglycan-associated protein
MMTREFWLVMGTVGVLGWLTAVPLAGHAQSLKDCREGAACTAADLAQALFPAPGAAGGPVRTRGVGPRPDAGKAPRPAAVALQVQFATNSNVLLPPYYAQLNALGTVLAQPQYATYRIQIEGHTDSVGADQANQVLSQQRAESVRRYLLQHFALPPDRLTAVGYGKTQPIASNETPDGRQKNRRVQVVNLGQ